MFMFEMPTRLFFWQRLPERGREGFEETGAEGADCDGTPFCQNQWIPESSNGSSGISWYTVGTV